MVGGVLILALDPELARSRLCSPCIQGMGFTRRWRDLTNAPDEIAYTFVLHG